MHPLKIVLYGPPGSGKDTHAEVLSKHFCIPSFSVGGIMREEIAARSQIGIEIEEYVKRGEISPGNVATRLLKDRLLREDCRDGCIVNGYPKTIASVDIYRSFDTPTHVIHLLLSDEKVYERLAERARHDDDVKIIAKRLTHYHSMEIPAFEYWKTFPDVRTFEVSTNAHFSGVSKEIVDFIRESIRVLR